MKKLIIALCVFLPATFLTSCTTYTTTSPGYGSNYVYTGSTTAYVGGVGYWPRSYNYVGYRGGFYNRGWNTGYYNPGWNRGYYRGWGRGGWYRR